jgi:hypothetical protein
MKPHIISHAAITADARFPGNNPDDSHYRRRLLAEGDSWFSLGSVPYENLLMELDFPDKTILVNIAEPGDEIVDMANPTRVKLFKRLVATRTTAYQWDAILLSGGGNDLIRRAGEILRSGSTAEKCVDKAALGTCMQGVAEAYRALAAVRDASGSVNANRLMITHTYDYPTPRDSPALFFGSRISGPWLYDDFVAKAIPESLWIPVADILLDALATTILGLTKGSQAIPNLVVVDTRGTLDRAALGAKKKSHDWRNEIHPARSGYRKIAPLVAARIP